MDIKKKLDEFLNFNFANQIEIFQDIKLYPITKYSIFVFKKIYGANRTIYLKN